MKLPTRLSGITTVLLLLTFLPGAVSAQGNSGRESAFCSSLPDRQSSVEQAFSNRISAYQQAVQSQNGRQSERQIKIDDELAEFRLSADNARAESYRLIRDKQPTEEDKAQADSYAGEVDQAIKIRRASYDSARARFHDTIDSLLSSRDKNMRGAIENFQNSVELAASEASDRCGDGRAGVSETRKQFVDRLKTARLSYAERLRTRTDFRAEVREAIKTRNEAYAAATSQFQQTMQAIREKYGSLNN